ncbi:OmpA family protein [Pseudomonas asiatica]|uniref:OmpA family protein n=1 Tax=Pseudomonas asiatica TaxID=2219225 RepID=UPI003877D00B
MTDRRFVQQPAALSANDWDEMNQKLFTFLDSSSEMNLALSQRRADATAKKLIAKGFDPSAISARGYGEHRPVADNVTGEGRALDRRIDIIICEEL